MRRKNKQKLTISLFILALLSIGLVYAYLTSNLSITGSTEISANSWNIHFANLNVTEGSVEATTAASIDTNDTTSISYAVKLNRPKDFYEFTVDVVNAGSLPGKVDISTISGITAEAENIVDYSVNYTNGKPLNIGDILNGGESKHIKVRVFYNDAIDEDDLPSTNLNLTLTYTLKYVQSEEDEFNTNVLIQQLKTNNSSCFAKYTGDVTDEVGQTVTASNVYFNRCEDKRNIIFAGYCWQMIRTTETSGIKMVYNGEVVNGKCESSRGNHKGIVQSGNGSYVLLDSSYLYGSSFTYNTSNNTFTLIDTETATWSGSTYENLMGKFTCKNTYGTCTTIYQLNGYRNDTSAYSSYYTIAASNYAQIGTSSFNASDDSPARVGYMFNKEYDYHSVAPTSGSLMGNDVSYSNGTYTLLPADGESELGTTKDATHHYTCNTTSSTCNKVRYYFYSSGTNNYYIELDGEANIEEAVNNMLYNDNVNRYNSSVKGIIDAWYAQNLATKTLMLEDVVYCNARDMVNSSANGWNKDGGLTTATNFKNKVSNNDLSCVNVTDQFSVSNNKAKLTYPVGLLEMEEVYTLDTSSLVTTGVNWWTISPNQLSGNTVLGFHIGVGGQNNTNNISNQSGVRPVVTLLSGTILTGGAGSETDPWIVGQ